MCLYNSWRPSVFTNYLSPSILLKIYWTKKLFWAPIWADKPVYRLLNPSGYVHAERKMLIKPTTETENSMQNLLKFNAKDTTTISLTLFCYFSVTLGKLFHAWPNEMQVFTRIFFFYFCLILIWYILQKLIVLFFSLMFLSILNS